MHRKRSVMPAGCPCPCIRTRRLLVSICLAAVWFCFGESGHSQTNAGGQKPARTRRLQIASNSGPPGSIIVLPVYFTPLAGEHLSRIQLSVTYSTPSLKFLKLEPAAAAAKSGIEVTGAAKAGKNEKGIESTIVTIIASSKASSSQGIPQGLLGSLRLRIGEKARTATIVLHAKASGEMLESNAPVEISVSDAHIEIAWVDAPPSVSCFFFSH